MPLAAPVLGVAQDVGDLATEETDLERVLVGLRDGERVEHAKGLAEVLPAVGEALGEGALQVVDIRLGEHQRPRVERAKAQQDVVADVDAVHVADVVQRERCVDHRTVLAQVGDRRPLAARDVLGDVGEGVKADVRCRAVCAAAATFFSASSRLDADGSTPMRVIFSGSLPSSASSSNSESHLSARCRCRRR